MAILHQLDKWSTTHPGLLLLLRAALGIALVSKGISFINDLISFRAFLAGSSFNFLPDWITFIITWIHLLCGFLITIGLFTRLSALIQIPILIGAVFINAPGGFNSGSELFYSLLILVLLVFFLFEGGGELSLDDYIKKHLI
jgi:putative oxidoreductase